MITWRQPLYADEQLSGMEGFLKFQWKYRKYPGDHYFIVLPEGENMPEIIQAVILKQLAKKRLQSYWIVGAASSKESALQLFTQMVQDAYKSTQTVDIRAFMNMSLHRKE